MGARGEAPEGRSRLEAQAQTPSRGGPDRGGTAPSRGKVGGGEAQGPAGEAASRAVGPSTGGAVGREAGSGEGAWGGAGGDGAGRRVEFWHLFAGPAEAGVADGSDGGKVRRDFGYWIREAGQVARDWDKLRDPTHDVLNDTFWRETLEAPAAAGAVGFLLGGVECTTFSVLLKKVLRPKSQPEGDWDRLTEAEAKRVRAANIMVRRQCRLGWLVWRGQGGFIFEHPTARDIEGTPFYWALKAGRASLRDMPDVLALQAATGAVWVFAPHCLTARLQRTVGRATLRVSASRHRSGRCT